MVGLYPGIYNNYAHFSTFFIICIVLLLLWLIGRESLARTGMSFQHLLDLRRKQALFHQFTYALGGGGGGGGCTTVTTVSWAHCSRDYFPS